MSILEFANSVEAGSLKQFDGFGYYHDGKKETDKYVCFDADELRDVSDKYPFVVWYNK